MLALIDGDIVAYRCAATAEGLEPWIAIARTRELLDQIISGTNASSYKVYLSGPQNFRYEIYPAYKANRNRAKTPQHLNVCRDYIVKEWQAEVTIGYEADDALGIAASEATEPVVICSIDKDLRQIPGSHYNFVKKEFSVVTPARGIRNFYEQMLIGDASDNIKGVPGIGVAKAPRLLEGAEHEQAMFDVVRGLYSDDALMLLNGQLLWIWKQANDKWTFDRIERTIHEVEIPSESTPPMVAETTQSMEHGSMNLRPSGFPVLGTQTDISSDPNIQDR